MKHKTKQGGMLLPLLLAGVVGMTWLAIHMSSMSIALKDQAETAQRNAELAYDIEKRHVMHRAASVLGAESTIAADGYPLPPMPSVLNAYPVAGGGFVGSFPATTQAPVAIGSGNLKRALGYCAWDNGATADTLGYLAGSNSPASTAFAVVHPGKDNIFQTTCQQSMTNLPQGDDTVIAVATTQLVKQATLP